MTTTTVEVRVPSGEWAKTVTSVKERAKTGYDWEGEFVTTDAMATATVAGRCARMRDGQCYDQAARTTTACGVGGSSTARREVMDRDIERCRNPGTSWMSVWYALDAPMVEHKTDRYKHLCGATWLWFARNGAVRLVPESRLLEQGVFKCP